MGKVAVLYKEFPVGSVRACRRCGIEKPLTREFFYFRKYAKSPHLPAIPKWQCIVCETKRTYEWQEKNAARCKENVKKRWARKSRELMDQRRNWQYGITNEIYEALLSSQGGGCGICGRKENISRKGKPRAMSVDHCHETGAVRGLLCNNCNAAIGHLQDDVEIVLKAALYLERSQNE